MKRKMQILIALFLLLSLIACKAEEGKPAGTEETVPPPTDNTAAMETVAEAMFNPLTGQTDRAPELEGQRAVAVNINNISVSWPFLGISKADVIVETAVEGGLTRLMCLFSDLRDVEQIGSVRSGQNSLIEAVAYLDPVFIHFGHSESSEYLIEQEGLDDINGLPIEYPIDNMGPAGTGGTEDAMGALFFQDAERYETYPSEHTWFIDGSKLADATELAGIEMEGSSAHTAFDFAAEGQEVLPADGAHGDLRFMFSGDPSTGSYYYDGDFRYDNAKGRYLRWQMGEPSVDALSGEQLAFDNVLVLFADIELKNGDGDSYMGVQDVIYQNGGEGFWFSKGRSEAFRWTKGGISDPFEFTGKNGEPLKLNAGKTYLAVVDNDMRDTLEM